jgi:hypothetical protein
MIFFFYSRKKSSQVDGLARDYATASPRDEGKLEQVGMPQQQALEVQEYAMSSRMELP